MVGVRSSRKHELNIRPVASCDSRANPVNRCVKLRRRPLCARPALHLPPEVLERALSDLALPDRGASSARGDLLLLAAEGTADAAMGIRLVRGRLLVRAESPATFGRAAGAEDLPAIAAPGQAVGQVSHVAELCLAVLAAALVEVEQQRHVRDQTGG